MSKGGSQSSSSTTTETTTTNQDNRLVAEAGSIALAHNAAAEFYDIDEFPQDVAEAFDGLINMAAKSLELMGETVRGSKEIIQSTLEGAYDISTQAQGSVIDISTQAQGSVIDITKQAIEKKQSEEEGEKSVIKNIPLYLLLGALGLGVISIFRRK